MPVAVRKTAITAVISAVATLLLTGCNNSQSPGAGNAPPAPEVGVFEIQPLDVMLTTELSGRISPHLIAEVRPQVDGIVLERPFEEGIDVEKDQVLYKIDPATYQAAHDSAKAFLARDAAGLDAARLKFSRYKELVKIKAVSQEAYDDASANLKQAQATIAVDKAALLKARINLDYTDIRAPIAGRIGRSSVTQGALVTANQAKPLATIQQIDPIYVYMTQSSADLLRLKRELSSGQLQNADSTTASVSLLLPDGSSYAQKGKLQFSEASVDERTGMVTIRAEFPNPQRDLLPGMYVRALVQEGVQQQAILAPQQGITRDAKGNATALVLNNEYKVEARVVNIERAVGNDWLVSNGLNAGDRLIVQGLQKVRPGATAVPSQSKASSADPKSGQD